MFDEGVEALDFHFGFNYAVCNPDRGLPIWTADQEYVFIGAFYGLKERERLDAAGKSVDEFYGFKD